MFFGVTLKVGKNKAGEVVSAEKQNSVIGETKEDVANALLGGAYVPNSGRVVTLANWGDVYLDSGQDAKTTTEHYIGELTEQVLPPPPTIKPASISKKK